MDVYRSTRLPAFSLSVDVSIIGYVCNCLYIYIYIICIHIIVYIYTLEHNIDTF